jgi:hypothetical protein
MEYLSPHLANQAIEAQRGYVSCTSSSNWEVVELMYPTPVSHLRLAHIFCISSFQYPGGPFGPEDFFIEEMVESYKSVRVLSSEES